METSITAPVSSLSSPPSLLPELLSIVLSFLSYPDWSAGACVGKDWQRASEMFTAVPPIDISKFIRLNRQRLLKNPHFPPHSDFDRRIKYSQLSHSSPNDGETRPSVKGRSIRSCTLVMSIDDSDIYRIAEGLSEGLSSGEILPKLESLNLDVDGALYAEQLTERLLVGELSHRLQVLIVRVRIKANISLPSLRVLQCDAISEIALEDMKQLESLHIITMHPLTTLWATIRLLSRNHSLRELICNENLSYVPPARQLFDDDDTSLTLHHLDIPFVKPQEWWDVLIRLPSIISVTCPVWVGVVPVVRDMADRDQAERYRMYISRLELAKLIMRPCTTTMQEDAMGGIGMLTGVKQLTLVRAGAITPLLQRRFMESISSMGKLEHLTLHGGDQLLTVDGIAALVDHCQELRSLDLEDARVGNLFCDQTIALLSSLPQFERLAFSILDLYNKRPVATRTCDLSTSMLQSISKSKSFRSIHISTQANSASKWEIETDQDGSNQLTLDLDYSGTLKHFRVYMDTRPSTRIDRIYSIRTLKLMNNVPQRDWLDQYGEPRHYIPISRPIESTRARRCLVQ